MMIRESLATLNWLRMLIPPWVVLARCEGALGAALLPEELIFAKSFSPKRLAEFASGRECARRAIASLGHFPGPIAIGPSRSPVWPPGIVGSITHTAGCCIAAAAETTYCAALGIDVELREAVGSEVSAIVLTDKEITTRHSTLPQSVYRTVLFSIKESVYKCYNPLVNRFLDFKDVEVTLACDGNCFEATIVNFELPSLAGRRKLVGRYAVDNRFVYSVLAIPRDSNSHRAGG